MTTTADHTPAAEPDASLTDLGVILPDLPTVTIGCIPARVKQLRTRELMLLIRVLTSGAGQSFRHLTVGAEDFEQQLIALLIMAIPEAGDEFVELLQAIVEPAEPIKDSGIQKLWNRELANPDPATTMDVLAALVAQERETFPALLGKAQLLIGQVQALYRTGKKNS
jgi:hypothetical protein